MLFYLLCLMTPLIVKTNVQTLDDKLRHLNIIGIGLAILGDQIKKRRISPDYRGLCPFHIETKPSFYLKALWNKYKCFGCRHEGTPIELSFLYLKDEDGLFFF